jgi:hypothetical protein
MATELVRAKVTSTIIFAPYPWVNVSSNHLYLTEILSWDIGINFYLWVIFKPATPSPPSGSCMIPMKVKLAGVKRS